MPTPGLRLSSDDADVLSVASDQHLLVKQEAGDYTGVVQSSAGQDKPSIASNHAIRLLRKIVLRQPGSKSLLDTSRFSQPLATASFSLHLPRG
jgi:hypothetical protein